MSRLQKLQQLVEKEQTPQYINNNDRPYTPEKGKDGNAYALVRFLWDDNNDVPYVTKYQHSWEEKKPGAEKGRWFIEDCPSTLKEKCPVCEANSEEYEKGIENYRRVAQKRKRSQNWYANILILKDPKHPENEGTVQLFRFGKKIKEKIDEAIKPQVIEGMDPPEAFDPFDLDTGANFHLLYKTIEGQNNVDGCKFDKISSILEDRKEREEVLSKCKPLAKLVDKSNFKSYDELKKKFEEITGKNKVVPKPTPQQIESPEEDDDLDFDIDFEDFKD